jgi:hypothetical protein
MNIFNLLNPSNSGVYSASNRNEYHKQKDNISGEKSAASAGGWQHHQHL